MNADRCTRILLIDENSDDRALATELLSARLGPVVVEAVADREAFARWLARGEFDAVVAEQHLAREEGLRILRALKERHPDRPVVLFTADGDPEPPSHAVRSAVDACVPKSSRGYLRLPDIVAELLGWPALIEARPEESPSRDAPAEATGAAAEPDGFDPHGELTRAVAHDLQEPLQLVTRYARLLHERYRDRLGDDGGRFLDHLVTSAERMQEMIDDLLEYSRVASTGRQAERTDLNEVFAVALQSLRGSVEETDARITHDPLPTVRADRSQMVRLFQNLLSNAIKYRGGAPPRIHVGACRREGCWALSVRDNGIGIRGCDRERIFRMFQRLHTASEYPGTGLGLSICERIVRAHGGSLGVESEPGVGSTFIVTLPPELAA